MRNDVVGYDREKAVLYAHRWAYSRNPVYFNYDKLGGDCTNFASQCILAGARVMNYHAVSGWYYKNANNKSPAWTGVAYLRDFLVTNGSGPGPYATEVSVEQIVKGDIVQLSFDGLKFQHTPFVVKTGPVAQLGNILVAAHTIDCDNRALNTYTFKKVRFLHIIDVNTR